MAIIFASLLSTAGLAASANAALFSPGAGAWHLAAGIWNIVALVLWLNWVGTQRAARRAVYDR